MRLGIMVDWASAAASSAGVEMQVGVSCIPEGGDITFVQAAAGRGLCLSGEMAPVG